MNFLILTLGCKVNTYESNVMRDLLLNDGYKEVAKNADIVIINTCTVTDTADSKSLKLIRQQIRKNPNCILIVVGCYAQINHEKLKDMEDVSIIIGNHDKSKILDYIKEYKKEGKQISKIYNINEVPFESMSLNNFNKTRAFVKIEDGCENFCSYCIIPYSRGKVRSKKCVDVIEEITTLVNGGHKEIVLTGIHTGHYGADLDNVDFSMLLERICQIKGLERLRISSIEITELNDKFMNVLKNNPIIVDHIHIPIQSGCTKTLKEMNRKYDVEYFINKINEIRKIRNDISISTDLIVGFPNETEEDFNETINTINMIRFSKIHVFPYSVRKGTKAELMPNQISENIKHERVKKIMELSKELEIEYMNKFINKEEVFIPEIKKDNCLIGHTGNYLLVKMPTDMELTHNDIQVIIEKVEYPYVIGKLTK
ncbi:MAG TPA: tRNA (N(6)-L-threonylcarbamoyladenosine(37)-C(2))-methylthiotransferase MtaB [Bacilli bacterium]|nr:tRNA (N(6)-L-threonylcarbamoyladenosine(37)-C(2))-methylthiotransferase MtaB [Bacilli bacterium]